MIGNSMSARLRQARRRALWSAASAAILILMAPAARAQFFFNLFEPPAVRVAHQLEVEGYDVRGLVRRGDVYVADVVAQGGDRERLVIDARTSRIVERFPSVATRWRDDRYGYGREREDPDSWDAPRPPLAVQQQRAHDEVARTDPSARPNVVYGEDGMNGPATSTFDVDKAKPRHVVKKKPAPAAPVAKDAPSAPPATEAVAPTSTPSPATVATTPPNAPATEKSKAGLAYGERSGGSAEWRRRGQARRRSQACRRGETCRRGEASSGAAVCNSNEAGDGSAAGDRNKADRSETRHTDQARGGAEGCRASDGAATGKEVETRERRARQSARLVERSVADAAP